MINVTYLIDKPDGDIHTIAKEMKLYSQCIITPQIWSNSSFVRQDMVIIPDPNLSYTMTAREIPRICREKGMKVVGMYHHQSSVLYEGVDMVIVTSPQMYLFAKDAYKDIPVIYLPESIDLMNYEKVELENDRFILGWLGNPPVIEGNFIHRLQYGHTVTAIANAIDCVVVADITESQPRAILEALSHGLPVLAQDTASARLLIPDEYLLPTGSGFSKVMIEKVNEIASDYVLREGLGRVSRAWAENIWDWDKNIKIWDDALIYLHKGKTDRVLQVGHSCIKPFAKFFEPTEKYSREIANFSTKQVELMKTAKNESYDFAIGKLIDVLKGYSLPYWFADKSCLDALKQGAIVSNPGQVILGVQDTNAKYLLNAFLFEQGAKPTDDETFFQGVNVHIIVESVQRVKQTKLYGKEIPVPFPVLPYLKERFTNV
jgi:hypothetical protein